MPVPSRGTFYNIERHFRNHKNLQRKKRFVKINEDEELEILLYFQVTSIRYEIAGGNLAGAFAVQNTSGAIYVAGKLDYETIKKYELKLEASNNLRKNYTTVIVHIRDVNDNPPIFERQTYKTQINEEEDLHLPKRIIKVQAIDADKDMPANILYFLSGQGIDPDNPKNSKFEVDRHTGEIFVLTPLDRDPPEGRPLWRFTVFAQDEGGEGLVGYADVQVVLNDINDNAPIFAQEVSFGNVTENGTVGMYVMTIMAIDYDESSSGANANIFYSIEKNVVEEETGFFIFDIDPHSGVIKTAVCCLDRERTSDYFIQIVATDGGGLRGTGSAIIQVMDINDMPPFFSKDEWLAEIDETDGSLLQETSILTVTVIDEDEINDFHYKIVENSGYGADKFQIVQNSDGSGSLKITKPLDYEDVLQKNGFRFQISVTDTENQIDKYHTAYSWVVIKLKDINDNSPVFQQSSINVLVPENFETGRILATFKATDTDQNGNSRVSYAIDKSSNRKSLFSITQQGAVSVKRSLDRENSINHQIIILAIDDGIPLRTSTATLNVVVQDINDNAPILIKDYRPVIMENVAAKEIVNIFAIDKDDYLAGNGPPFQFLMDPNASAVIQNSFSVEFIPKGDGTAIVKSLRSLDREKQKEYKIPIVIKDSGNPVMTGTSTLTVTVGDINDNKMKNAIKNISVYKYQGQQAEIEIGRVYVYDLDDWDLPDKKFYWESVENPYFKLNEKTGMITISYNIVKGTYVLSFKVFDKTYTHTVSATVLVTIKELTSESVLNSGSVRIAGITDEDFIQIWDYKQGDLPKSKQEHFREKIAEILKIDQQNIEIFSVQLKSRYPPVTDVRFSAHLGSQHLQPVKINGLVLIYKQEIENFAKLNISMVGLSEFNTCKETFNSIFNSSALSNLVDANKTALVSPRIEASTSCSCKTKNFTEIEQCKNVLCYNGGTCIESKHSVSCQCRQGYEGPKCKKSLLSFKGNGWAWYPSLRICEQNHLHLDFLTVKPDGLLFYNGPLVVNKNNEIFLSDFISIELKQGYPRLLINYGSDTVELNVNTKAMLNNGKWHRLDIFWNVEIMRIVVDFCQSANIFELNDDTPSKFDDSSCQAQEFVPSSDEYLNVNTPLQFGGIWPQTSNLMDYNWNYMPTREAFDGCIKNVVHNSELLDLTQPALYENVYHSCNEMEASCKQLEDTIGCIHGYCQGDRYEANCHCHPGWSGINCSIPTIPTTFKSQSYVKYALNFELDRFITQLQIRFRTRKKHSELFRISDLHSREYAILEIVNSYLWFRYNFNSVRTEETNLVLSTVSVDDGEWHVAKVYRYGSVAILKVDSGEGKRYNESFKFVGQQFLSVDNLEGVHAGGTPELTGISTFVMNGKFQTACLDDIRLNGKHLPLPPAINGTQWGQVIAARNLERNCLSNNPCGTTICPDHLNCVDIWNDYECRCSEGRVLSPYSRECIDKNECLDSPCLNGGICINLGSDLLYKCKCQNGFWGNNCEMDQEQQRLKISIEALSSIFICLLIIFGLALIFVFYHRSKVVKKKRPSPNTDLSDNVINYKDEEGGENAMTGLDITPLQIPVNKIQAETDKNNFEMTGLKATERRTAKAVTFLEDHADRTDIYFDVVQGDLRSYSYGGVGNTPRHSSALHSDTIHSIF